MKTTTQALALSAKVSAEIATRSADCGVPAGELADMMAKTGLEHYDGDGLKVGKKAPVIADGIMERITTLSDKSGADRDHLVNVLLEQAMDEADAGRLSITKLTKGSARKIKPPAKAVTMRTASLYEQGSRKLIATLHSAVIPDHYNPDARRWKSAEARGVSVVKRSKLASLFRDWRQQGGRVEPGRKPFVCLVKWMVVSEISKHFDQEQTAPPKTITLTAGGAR